MTDTRQPEALYLADELEKCWADPGLQLRSAAELRRLHAENIQGEAKAAVAGVREA